MNKYEMKTYGHYKAMAQSAKAGIEGMRGTWSGEDIYCVGTGPSIKQTSLSHFNGKSVIYLNNAVELRPEFKAKNELCLITDHLRMSELRAQLIGNDLRVIASTDKVFSVNVDWRLFDKPVNFVMPKLNVNPRSNWLTMSVSMVPGFSEDLLKGIYIGKSVVFSAIQTAVYLGASRVYLAGIDMTLGKSEYFASTTRSNWSGFDYEKDGVPHFRAMLESMNALGIPLVNASQGGMLDVVPRDFDLLRC